MKKKMVIVTVLAVLAGIVAGPVSAKEKLTFGVVPQMSAVEVHKRWTPVLEKIAKEAGIEIELRTYQTIPQFEAEILKGAPDFAYMNPYHEVMGNDAHGYIPLVKDKANLVGIMVAKKGGDVKSVKDLNGKEVTFPAPNAFAASLYMRALLERKEKVKITPMYVKTHENVYRSVALGKAGGGGGVRRTLEKEEAELKVQLEIIYETPGSASHPIAAHPRVNKKVREAVKKALLNMGADSASQEMLKGIQIPEPVAADYKADYLPLKKLGLEKYVVLEQ